MKNKGWRAKLISILLVVTLAMSGVTGVQAQEKEKQTVEQFDGNQIAEQQSRQTGCEVTAVLRVDGYGESSVYPTSVTLPDTYKSFQEYGLTNEKDPGYYTPLHLMAQYCVDHGIDPANVNNGISISDGFLLNFLGIKSNENTFFMFEVNHTVPANGATGYTLADCPLKAGDNVVIYDWYWSDNSAYAYFTEENVSVSAGQEFAVTLMQNDGMSADVSVCKGAELVVQDSQGNILQKDVDYTVSGKTGEDGRATVVILEKGTYILTAERKNVDGYHELNRPYVKVEVGKSVGISDEEAVQKAKESLSVDGAEAVGDAITLPVVGAYGTSLTWELKNSEDKEYVALQNGSAWQFYRPVKEDYVLVLTVTITKGAASVEKDISLTLKGKVPRLAGIKVNYGTLKFDSDKKDYVLYIPQKDEQGQDIKELEIEVDSGECALVWINNAFAFGAKKISLNTDGQDTVVTIDGEVRSNAGNLRSYKETVATITVKRGNPGEPIPDLPDIAWGQHLGDKNNNAVVDVKTPEGEGGLLWESFSNAPDSWGSVYAGTPILVNGSIYAVRNHKLEMLDARTGKVQASAELASKVGYYSNIIYGGGMIFVPLGDGSVQSFHAATLESLYLLASPAPFGKSYSVYGAMHYDEGRLYIGYSDGSYVNPVGCYAAYDTMDLDINSETEEITELWVTEGRDGQSYYGSGAVTVEDKVIVAGDSGIAYVHNSETGDKISEVKLDGKVRGALVYAESYIWAVTQNAKIYKLSLSETGSLSIVAEGQLPLSTSASPVVVSGKVYITGGSFDKGGFFAVYDLELNLLAEERTENSLNTPTVTTAYDDTYAYFTENGEAGSLYMAKITGNNKVTVTKIYTPEHPQYSMSKVVVGVDGTLYYGNDAGYLYAICAKAGEKPDDGKDDGSDQEQGGNKGTDSNANKNITSVTQLKNLAPQTRTVRVNASKGKTESVKDKLIEAVENSGKKEKNSLTVDNPPEIIEAEVFAALAEYPGLRLILNCGNYTLSIKGSEITDTSASLSTKLIEFEDTLSEKEAEKYGNHQQLALVQEGSLPGKITVVYHLGEQLEGSETLYLYDLAQEEVQKVTVEKPYAMFVMTHAGSYILSDMQADEGVVSETAGGIPDSLKTKDTGTKKASSLPVWVYLLIGLSSGVLLSGVITASILRARKRRETWEE